MARVSALLLALVLGGAGALALTSCGGGSDAKLLPGAKASQIESSLDQVRELVAAGDCIGAENEVAAVAAEVEELNEVAPKLKAALQEGTTKLSEVVSRCEEGESEETEPSAQRAVEEGELEAEEREAEEKAEKAQEKAEKQQQKNQRKEEEKAAPPQGEEGELPPQAEGKGKAKGHDEAPPPAAEPPAESESGGVSPGVGVE